MDRSIRKVVLLREGDMLYAYALNSANIEVTAHFKEWASTDDLRWIIRVMEREGAGPYTVWLTDSIVIQQECMMIRHPIQMNARTRELLDK